MAYKPHGSVYANNNNSINSVSAPKIHEPLLGSPLPIRLAPRMFFYLSK